MLPGQINTNVMVPARGETKARENDLIVERDGGHGGDHGGWWHVLQVDKDGREEEVFVGTTCYRTAIRTSKKRSLFLFGGARVLHRSKKGNLQLRFHNPFVEEGLNYDVNSEMVKVNWGKTPTLFERLSEIRRGWKAKRRANKEYYQTFGMQA